MTDVRLYFDRYIAEYSTVAELVEVLQFTYLFGSRCIGYVRKRQAS